MNIVLGIIGKLKVDNHIDTFDVEAPSSDIRRHENIVITFTFELLHHAIALRLRE